MKKLKRLGIAIAASSIAISSIVVPAHAQEKETPSLKQDAVSSTELQESPALAGNVGACTPVHIITVNGTGASSDKAKSDIGTEFQTKFARELEKKNPGQVSSYLVPYPAAAGAIYSINPLAASATTYGESRLRGVARSLEHIEQYAEKCPNSAYLMYGYSQGASVAGDVTALLANGILKNVDKDKILGAVLLADPGNSGASQKTGPSQNSQYYIPHPPNAVYSKNGEMMHTLNNSRNVGWTGQRSVGFDGIEGRVISLCSEGDLACSTPPGDTVQRNVADLSDKNINPNWAYTYGVTLLMSFVLQPKESLKLFGGNLRSLRDLLNISIDKIIKTGKENLKTSDLDIFEKATWTNAFDEAQQINDILHSDKMYGDKISDVQIVAHILSQAGDTIISLLPPQLKQFEPQVQDAVKWASVISLSIGPSKLVKATPVINSFAIFPERHGHYFNHTKMKIGDKAASEWAIEAADKGINNYIRHSPLTLASGFSGGTGQKELAEENRLPDGLEDMLKNGYQKYLITTETMPDSVKKEILNSGGDPNKVVVPEEEALGDTSNSKNDAQSNTDKAQSKDSKRNISEEDKKNAYDSLDKFFKEDKSSNTKSEKDRDPSFYDDDQKEGNNQKDGKEGSESSGKTEDEKMIETIEWMKEMKEKDDEDQKENNDIDNSNSSNNVVKFSSPHSDSSRSIGQSTIRSGSELAPSTTTSNSNHVVQAKSPNDAMSNNPAKESKKKEIVGPSVDTGGMIEEGIFQKIKKFIFG